jgi:hypothetical protein
VPEIHLGTTTQCGGCRYFFDADLWEGLPDPLALAAADAPDPPHVVAGPVVLAAVPRAATSTPRPSVSTRPTPTETYRLACEEPPPVRLTHAHRCLNRFAVEAGERECGHEIFEAAGRRQSSRVCPGCQRRTSVYAVLHRCGKCGVVLESPLRCSGSLCPCPQCNAQFTVPHDEVLVRDDPLVEPDWPSFACAACGVWLAAPPGRAGTAGCCPSCLAPFPVPLLSHGRQHRPEPGTPHADHGTRLRPEFCRRCRSCRTPLPHRAVACPRCGDLRAGTLPTG